jgi:DNA replication protein DnaC
MNIPPRNKVGCMICEKAWIDPGPEFVIKSLCPICNDGTIMPIKAKDLSTHIMQIHLKRQFEKSDFPKKYIMAELAHLPETYHTHPDGCIITGQAGVGKTYAMAAMMRYLIEDGERYCFFDRPTMQFIKAPELFLQLRNSYQRDAATTEMQIIDKYTSVDWLFLDDLATEKPSDWVLASLDLIVCRLYDLEKKLVISTNSTIAELGRIYGDRALSRILEMCRVIEMGGADKRPRKRTK